MGREMLYDNLHVCYRVAARNNRTVEQMWGSSVPHFPGFKIVSIDSHRSQMSHHRHELALHAGHLVWFRPTCGSLRMIKAREGVSSSVNSSYLLWGYCPPPPRISNPPRKTPKTQKHQNVTDKMSLTLLTPDMCFPSSRTWSLELTLCFESALKRQLRSPVVL